MPPVQNSSGAWTGSGARVTCSNEPTGPSWSTVSPAHSRRRSGKRLVHTRPLLLAGNPNRPRLGRLGQPRNEGHQQPPVGQPVEGGELLGQADHVAAGKQHRRSQLQPGIVGGGERQCGQRVERRRAQYLGQPQRVEAELVEIVHQRGEGRRIAVERAGAHPDPDLHPAPSAGPSKRSTVANSSTGDRRNRVG